MDALSKSLELPVSLGQALLPALTGEGGPGGVKVTRETLDRLDVTRPLAVIWLAPGSGVAGWLVCRHFIQRARLRVGCPADPWDWRRADEGTFERRLPSGDVVCGRCQGSAVADF